MDVQRDVLGSLTCLAVAATLAGLVKSGRARYCLSFVAYLAAILTCEALYVLWPADFFVAVLPRKQALYDVLRTAVALEMAWRVVRSFPGALRTARVVGTLLLVGAIAVIASGPHRSSYARSSTGSHGSSLHRAALHAHGPAGGLVSPADSGLHRAIMGGFAMYSVFFATVLSLLQRWGWEIRGSPTRSRARCCWASSRGGC